MIKLNKLYMYEIKASIKPWISFKNVHRVMTYNENAWLKLYNTDLKIKAKNDFEKDFLS